VIAVFWIGLFPNPLLTRMHATVDSMIENLDRSTVAVAKLAKLGSDSNFGTFESDPNFTGL
jgi:hypothetical protein